LQLEHQRSIMVSVSTNKLWLWNGPATSR